MTKEGSVMLDRGSVVAVIAEALEKFTHNDWRNIKGQKWLKWLKQEIGEICYLDNTIISKADRVRIHDLISITFLKMHKLDDIRGKLRFLTGSYRPSVEELIDDLREWRHEIKEDIDKEEDED